MRGLPTIPAPRPSAQDCHPDFWIPQMTQNGEVRASPPHLPNHQTDQCIQIYYAHTVTGQHSRDIPSEQRDGVADIPAMAPTPPFSGLHAGGGTGLELVSGFATPCGPAITSHPCFVSSAHPISVPPPLRPSQGLSVSPASQRTSLISNTPYLRTRSKTDASPPPALHPHRVPGVLFDTLTAQLRQSQSSNRHHVNHQRSRSEFTARPLPIPKSPQNHSCTHTPNSVHLGISPILPQLPEVRPPTPPPKTMSPQPIAQQSLSPSSPELVSELLQRAVGCIHAVILHLQQFGVPLSHVDEEIIDGLTSATITSIRDLLYVAGPSFGDPIVRNGDQPNNTHAAQTHLVPAQRRTIATLSRFVLSMRAVLNDAPWGEGDPVSHLGSEAEELEQAVTQFVSMAQRVFHGDEGPKRLHGYLSASPVSLGNAGAGAAGTWKGFGWVNIDGNEEAPRRSLDRPTFDQLLNHVSRVKTGLSSFMGNLRASREGVYPIESIITLSKDERHDSRGRHQEWKDCRSRNLFITTLFG